MAVCQLLLAAIVFEVFVERRIIQGRRCSAIAWGRLRN